MTDPVHATLWLIVAAVLVLVLCLGGTLIAAGLWRRPDPQRGELPRRGIGEAIAAELWVLRAVEDPTLARYSARP